MLGKQWLNRYVSTDMRGSMTERCRNRQRKLDGIVAWYFDSVLESLPLMLQVALMLLGCALSRYLWDINITIASVVIGVTSLGVFFYISIVAAGAVSKSCPYQTPGSRALRYLGRHVPRRLHSILSSMRNTFRKSEVINTIITNVLYYRPCRPRGKIIRFLKDLVFEVPPAFATDVHCLGRATVRAVPALPVGVSHLVRRAYNRFHAKRSSLEGESHRRIAAWDLRCILWTLQTSLDQCTHNSALKHLLTMPELAYFDPILVSHCFNVFVGCVSCSNYKVVVVQGLEQLATVSAGCFFRTFHYLSVTDPTSSVLENLRQRYNVTFPSELDVTGLPFYSTMVMMHVLASRDGNPRDIQWRDFRPSRQEHIPFAQYMVEAAQVGYQQTHRQKVPRWILAFALHSLSLEPPLSVVAECLTIIAIDLGYDVSKFTALDVRWVQLDVLWMPAFLTKHQFEGEAGLKPHHKKARNHG
jgi:hypothetical protein